MAATHSATESAGLNRGAIGLREVLFQAVTSMAPAGALALSISLGATYAGGALPLSVLLALVGCLLVASSIGQLARHLPSAGSIYTYPAVGIQERPHPIKCHGANGIHHHIDGFEQCHQVAAVALDG